MQYDPQTQTLLAIVAPGNESEVAESADIYDGIKGTTQDGAYVAQVAYVFIGGPDAAAPHLDLIRSHGLECRVIANGREVVIEKGERVERDRRLLPILRAEDWPHLDRVPKRRLFDADRGPWITWGWDEPDTITALQHRHLEGRSVDAIEAEALENLAEVVPALGDAEDGALFCSGEYGAAAVLLPDVMREVARQLDSSVIAVGIPWDGGFGAVPADDPVRTEALVRWTRGRYDEAPARPISPTPLLVGQGRPLGFVRFDDEPEPQSPWWRFWA